MIGHPLFLAFVAIVALVSLIALRRGLRGRRIDNHPICARCGFDLTGLSFHATCPECGTGTGTFGARRRGARAMSSRPLIVGASLAPIWIIGVAMIVADLAAPSRLQRLKPVAWLVFEAVHGQTVSQSEALHEILARVSLGNATKTDVVPLLEHILKVQADPTKPWLASWGDCFEQLRALGVVGDAEWVRYGRQSLLVSIGPTEYSAVWAPLFELQLQPRVGRGSPLLLRAYGSVVFGPTTYSLGFNGQGVWGRDVADAQWTGMALDPRTASGPPVVPGPQAVWCSVVVDIEEMLPNGTIRTLHRHELREPRALIVTQRETDWLTSRRKGTTPAL